MLDITVFAHDHIAPLVSRCRAAISKVVPCLVATLSSSVAFAQTVGDVAGIAHESLAPSMKLSTAVVFFVGFMLVGTCLFKLYVTGRNPGTHNGGTYFASLLGLAIGVFMVYQAWVVGMGGETFFGAREVDMTIEGTTEVR